MKGDLSVRESAVEMGCSTKWIYDLLYARRIPGARKLGKSWRIPRQAIQARKAVRARAWATSGEGTSGSK